MGLENAYFERAKLVKGKHKKPTRHVGTLTLLLVMFVMVGGAIYVGVLASGPQSDFFHRYLVSGYTAENAEFSPPTTSVTPPERDIQ